MEPVRFDRRFVMRVPGELAERIAVHAHRRCQRPSELVRQLLIAGLAAMEQQP
jgi:predicted DNA-binding protein